MIHIAKPYITKKEGSSRLCSEITIDGKSEIVWFEVESRYEEYLCWERSDAFLVAVLNYAMRYGHDISCEAPIGEYLHYQVINHVIEALSLGDSKMYRTKIYGDVDCTLLPCKGAVGTGISCGVDSLHSIAQNTSKIHNRHNISHLAFNNVGSHGEGERAVNLFNKRRALAKSFAVENGFEYVESNSNLMDVVKQNHYLTHTFSSTFAIIALQKLYSVYYYASSVSYNDFSLKDNSTKGSGRYELLSLSMFSTENLRIYSEGATSSRLEKVRRISKYHPAYTTLNVCLVQFDNCGRCEKCLRTLFALDVCNSLDNFYQVFDIEDYRVNKNSYLPELYLNYLLGKVDYQDLYSLIKDDISSLVRVKVAYLYFKITVYNFIFKKLIPFIKQQ